MTSAVLDVDDVATQAGMHTREQVGGEVPGSHRTTLKSQARGLASTHKGPQVADDSKPIFNDDPVNTTHTKDGAGVSREQTAVAPTASALHLTCKTTFVG